MKKLLAAVLLAVFLTFAVSSLHAQDQDKNLGIGFMIGEPTGLSLKSWTGGNNALDLGLAWSLDRYDAVSIHGDYLWHNYEAFQEVDEGTLPLYYGIGARLTFNENTDAVIGGRVPVGINYLFEDAPIGLFLEVAPTINLVPSTYFDVDGGLGIRFYLN